MKTVVGLFSTTAEAQQVKQALVAQGYSSSDVTVHANDAYDDEGEGTGYNETTAGTGMTRGTSTTSTTGTGETGTGIGHKISNFFSSLTGGDDNAHQYYAQGVNQGSALLSVKTEDDNAYSVAALLRQHGARDIEGGSRSASYEETTDTRGTAAANTTGQTAIPIVEEELVVGKREVDLGGVRVYSHIIERPVSADVSLHNERIDVERRSVNRPATAADFQVGSQPIELRATGEEAVVGKTARVVEEVTLGKQASDRTETVNDTVRKTEVDIEELPGATTSRTGYADATTGTSTTKDRF